MPWSHEELQEGWRTRRLVGRLTQFRDLVDLPDGRFLIHTPEDGSNLHEQGAGRAAAEYGDIGRIAEDGIVDRSGARPTDVLLGDEVCGPDRRGVIGICRGKQFADEGQRADLAAAIT